MFELYNVRIKSLNVRKNKRITKYDKRTVICDVGTVQCEAGTIKCEKKKKRTTECDKVQSHVMLVLRNVRLIP